MAIWATAVECSAQRQRRSVPERGLEVGPRHVALERQYHMLAVRLLEVDDDRLIPSLDLTDVRVDEVLGAEVARHRRAVHLPCVQKCA